MAEVKEISSNHKILSWLKGFAYFLIISNLLFWIITQKMNLNRGILVAEYFVLGALFIYIRKKWFIVFWILLSLLDLLYASSSIFFMDFFAMMEAAAGVKNIFSFQMVIWVLQVIAFILIIRLLLQLLLKLNNRDQFMRPWYLISYLLIVVLVDFLKPANNYQQENFKDPIVHNANIVSAPSLSYIRQGIYALTKRDIKHTRAHSVAKSFFIPGTDTIHREKKQLLILVESWGLLTNEELRNELIQPFRELAKEGKYNIREGTSEFRFLTQIAEMREITGHEIPFDEIKEDFANKNSLFIQKQLEGFRIIGVHGFSNQFHSRNKWWPMLGVQEMYFSEQFVTMGLPFEGNEFFKGASDTAIAKWVFQKLTLEPSKSEFYYWVTLNTHLPLEERFDDSSLSFRARWQEKIKDADVVQLSFQLKELFEKVANLLKECPEVVRVLVIGDHAPPFTHPDRRKHFDPMLVPYVKLSPER